MEQDYDSGSAVEDAEQEPLWSIDDDTLFHPIGLCSHGTAGRSVFVVWSEDQLLNFVFRKSARSQRAKMTKARLSLVLSEDAAAEPEQIEDLLILELNTLLLMRSGRVFYFSSVRAAHTVPWLSGVRCISSARTGFSVIRLRNSPADTTLSLEIYRDVEQLGQSASTLLQRFDITYDERNLFNCEWSDECFTLLSQPVSAQHVGFLEELCGQEFELKDVPEVHFFTVSGSVFALIADNASPEPATSTTTPAYHIQLLSTYAANIEFMKILLPQRLCLVFLACGTVDIWYHSSVANALQRTAHHTGSGYTHHTFDATNACFYYTDTEASQVTQLQFEYDTTSDTVQVRQTHKPIAGILALTWVESIQQLICLSWNNIFYQMVFENKTTPTEETSTIEYENSAELFELTPRKIAKLLAKAQAVEELMQLPKLLHAEIESEFQQQQLISLATKTHLYKNFFDATLEYSTQVPSVHSVQQHETLLLYTQSTMLLRSNSLFALIYLKISKNDIFQAALWNLHISDSKSGETHILNVPPALLHHNLCIIVPTAWTDQSLLLPEYKLKLLSFVSFESNFLAITISIDLKQTARTYANLFSARTSSLSMCSEFSLANLIAQFNKETDELRVPTTICYILKLDSACTFDSILALFRTSRTVLEEFDIIELNFLSVKVKLTFTAAQSSGKFLKLESTDAVALYYAKIYLYRNLTSALEAEQTQLLLQHQCIIERCYGTLIAQSDSEPVTSSMSLHLENLKRIYTKIRSDFGRQPS